MKPDHSAEDCYHPNHMSGGCMPTVVQQYPKEGCTCIYCGSGRPHPHTAERFVPLLGNPLVSVCTNCGHKAVFKDADD